MIVIYSPTRPAIVEPPWCSHLFSRRGDCCRPPCRCRCWLLPSILIFISTEQDQFRHGCPARPISYLGLAVSAKGARRRFESEKFCYSIASLAQPKADNMQDPFQEFNGKNGTVLDQLIHFLTGEDEQTTILNGNHG